MELPLIHKILSLLFSLITLLSTATGQVNWELSKDKNDIKVYTRKTDSSKFKAVKVEAVLPGNIQKLVSILMGIEKNIKWVYATKTLRLIKRFDANELIYYAETSLPWPMRNRDQAILITLFPDSLNHRIKIITVGKPKEIPLTRGIVRVPYFLGVWHVTALDTKNISISYYLNVDPGGNLPAWIVNMFVAKGPYETFTNLAGLLKE